MYNCCISEGCGVKSGKGVGMIIINMQQAELKQSKQNGPSHFYDGASPDTRKVPGGAIKAYLLFARIGLHLQ